MPLLTLEDAKAQLNITSTDNDEELQAYVNATVAVVERVSGRVVEPRTATETLTANRALLLSNVPVLSLTLIERKDSAADVDMDALRFDAESGLVTSTTVNPLNGVYTVTYEAGMENPPANYGLAARIIVQHLYEVQRGNRGAPRFGGETTVVPGYGYAVPNRAIELLGTGLAGIA